MKRSILTLITLLVGLTTYGQINMADSTVQVISYWEKGEKRDYSIKNEHITIEFGDTVINRSLAYDVEITVLDSTEESYTIQWLYKNILSESSSDKDDIWNEIARSYEGVRMIFNIDAFGVIERLINGDEIRQHIEKTLVQKGEHLENQSMLLLQTNVPMGYATDKTGNIVIGKDILQFHNFYGNGFKLGEIAERKWGIEMIPGTGLIDWTWSISLEEINQEENHYRLHSIQGPDRQQFIDASFAFQTYAASKIGTPPPDIEALETMTNDITTVSTFHDTGWLIRSDEATVVMSGDGGINSKRTIKLKDVEP